MKKVGKSFSGSESLSSVNSMSRPGRSFSSDLQPFTGVLAALLAVKSMITLCVECTLPPLSVSLFGPCVATVVYVSMAGLCCIMHHCSELIPARLLYLCYQPVTHVL